MEVETDQKKKGVLCQICKKSPSKYTCPGCNKRTCSLDCVRRHKKDDQCSGVRNRTKYVAMGEFDDKVLNDDYFFLSDIARRVDSSIKNITDFPGWNTPHMVEEAKDAKNLRVHSYMATLVKQAADRNVNLITLPLGMTRQKENRTRYISGKGVIMWYAKWNLASISPVLTFSTRCSELDTIGSTLIGQISGFSNHLYPLLSKYKSVGIDGIIILMEKYSPYDETQETTGIPHKEFYIIPPGHSFRTILSGVTLLEYPEFHVIFPSDLAKYNVQNLPMVPVEDWKAPERTKRPKGSQLQGDENANAEDEKRQKVEKEHSIPNQEHV